MARRSDHNREELHRMALDAASDIVAHDGLRGLSTRRIAKQIGYTAGTLYQVFQNIDDLIEQMNAMTLDALRVRCEQIELGDDPAVNLWKLVETYRAFSEENRNLWAAIFDNRRSMERQPSKMYNERVRSLYGFVERAISPFYAPGQEARRLHDARVLWTCFYGISTLARDELLSAEETVETMIGTVVEMFVQSRQAGQHDGVDK